MQSAENLNPNLNMNLMKNKILAITFFSVAAFAVGCHQEPTASQQLDKLKTETKEAAQEIKDYNFSQKDQFVEKMQGQLAEMNRELDLLSTKVAASSDKAKAEANPKLEALRTQTDKLKKQLDEAKNATESGWDNVKGGFKKGYGELKEGFQQARQWVSDKIAP
jgi:arginine utilization protein RocB